MFGLKSRNFLPKPKEVKIMNETIKFILTQLDQLYPKARTELNHNNALELLVATILSAQCTDKKVNQVTEKLFQKYLTPEDYLKVPAEELENDIHSTGFYHNKAKSIRGAMQVLISQFNGRVPDRMTDLLKLPGVARKTANVVLSNFFHKPEGIAVDTHMIRVSRRLGLTENSKPEKIERDLLALIPREKWIDFNHQLILLGRYICPARKPLCEQCPLSPVCQYYKNLKS